MFGLTCRIDGHELRLARRKWTRCWLPRGYTLLPMRFCDQVQDLDQWLFAVPPLNVLLRIWRRRWQYVFMLGLKRSISEAGGQRIRDLPWGWPSLRMWRATSTWRQF